MKAFTRLHRSVATMKMKKETKKKLHEHVIDERRVQVEK